MEIIDVLAAEVKVGELPMGYSIRHKEMVLRWILLPMKSTNKGHTLYAADSIILDPHPHPG